MPNEDIAILNPFNAMPAEQAIMVAVYTMQSSAEMGKIFCQLMISILSKGKVLH